MKKLFLGIFVLAIAFTTIALAAPKEKCTTIQSGTLLAGDGTVIPLGYDKWGYNYQADMFNGYYCDAYRDAAWCQQWKDVKLAMKWNNAWLSNQDCNGDGKLDRHYGYTTYVGSGAWLTNHQSGLNPDGSQWNDFVKIVAKPTSTFNCASVGAIEIWGEFCLIQEVTNDPSAGMHGKQLLTNPAGFGAWK
ncbi:MAG TPA: hypothetical protein VJJ21_04995 [Candidatus Nanoarchaeia archaeon]|nr:hypothetical protein [Candidatus Nanoarchaeia archaeon]